MISLTPARVASSFSRPAVAAALPAARCSFGKMRQGGYMVSSDVVNNAARGGAGAPSGARGTVTAATGGGGAPAGNIVDAITDDHKRLFSYCDQLRGQGLGHDQREHLRHQLVHDLAVHSLSEEEVLYPALKNACGNEMRNHVLDEHTTLKHILMDIDKMDADDPNFNPRLDELVHELRHHVQEEEEKVLPMFASKVPTSDLEHLGDKFERTKGQVPTRPHILAPNKPATGNVVVDRLTAPLDKLRDSAGGREV
ncbi:putative hemerythrin-like protein [Monoraphidium neglectum]|uniref:Putative hemerythrin-like protein n=1 Tax=Monoraphidium neglectum TaxID=145388 RepID=A0A0D2MI25_9CHLO|nr:putative hemerythrin-like protein [Monoraphidium neglectum]KIZ02650.1 putative hemerythrin-like protein [Monoraphidium neglectum]|eukprot:XP_013901669.1 putative hemerythrin-like protein [Monoraphidium neglectum]